VKIYTIAHVPQDLVQEWLQHLRDFDVGKQRCHFQIIVEPTDQAEAQAKFDLVQEMLKVDPPLPVNIVRRKH